MNPTETPIGKAIILCDRVITEEGTLNKTIISTFNTIGAKNFPCLHQSLAVYVALTNAMGPKEVRLLLKRGEEVLSSVGGRVPFDGPNNVVELIFNFKNTPFTEPGLYTFEVQADGEYIMETRFNVTKTE